jgi:hypothetical protein
MESRFAVAVGGMLAAVLAFADPPRPPTLAKPTAVAYQRTAKPPELTEFVGIVFSPRATTLSAGAQGTVAALHVWPGKQIDRGELLVEANGTNEIEGIEPDVALLPSEFGTKLVETLTQVAERRTAR